MKRRTPKFRPHPLALAFLLASLAAAPVGLAAEEGEEEALPDHGPAAEAAARVQTLFEDAAAITGDDALPAETKRARVEQLLEPFLDYTTLARAALGASAERFTREEYVEFSHEYARFVTASIVRRFAAFPGKGSEVTGAHWNAERGVATVVARGREGRPGFPGVWKLAKREPMRIQLALHKRHGEWRLVGFKRGVVDVGRSFREQFAAALEREEPVAIIAELRERNRRSDTQNPFASGN